MSQPLGRHVLARIAVFVCTLSMLASLLPQPTVATDPPANSRKDGGIGISSHNPSTAINSSGPLTRIEISEDLNCAVSHRDDTDPEFFGDEACATLVAVDGVLYGPATIPAGGSASPRTAFTPVSQSGVTGSGLGADPYTIVTTVDAGVSGIRLIQTDTYVEGREAYRTDVEIENRAGAHREVVLYRAGDCYLQNSDDGFGRADPTNGAVGCVSAEFDSNGGRVPGDRIEQWLPLNGDGHYMEAFYDDLWAHIGTQQDFPNTIVDDYIDNGAGLSWREIIPSGLSLTRSHYTTFSPSLADTQVCELEETIELPPPDGLTPQIRVRYDPRFIVPESRPDFEAQAEQIAAAVQAQAHLALAGYAALELNIPDDVTVEITCDVRAEAGPIVVDELVGSPAGFTESENTVKLRASYIARQFRDAVRNGFPDAWTNEDGWVNLVDHEMFHTIQHLRNFQGFELGLDYDSNNTAIESGAVAGQDLLPGADDLPQPAVGHPGSYRSEINPFFDFQPTILAQKGDVTDPGSGPDGYHAAAVLQYWGERFGTAGAASLEERVAGVLAGMINNSTGEAAMRDAIGRDVWDALRDFYVAAYALDAPNVRPDSNRAYQILDRDIARGDAGGPSGASITEQAGQSYPALDVIPRSLAAGPVVINEVLERGRGEVYEVALPPDIGWVRLDIETRQVPGEAGPLRRGRVTEAMRFLRLALVPTAADDSVSIEGGLMFRGPRFWESHPPRFIDLRGSDRLAIVAVTSGVASDYTLTLESVAGAPSVEVLSATSSPPGSRDVTVEVRARLGSELALGRQPADFTVEIAGASVAVERVEELSDRQILYVRAPVLEGGSYGVAVGFDGASDTKAGALVVPAPEPGPAPEPIEMAGVGTFGALGQGDSASAQVVVTAAASSANFGIDWVGSDFALTLTAPSGRVITESSTDADVQVVQSATSVDIRVANAEGGTWTLGVSGTDVPDGPEPVTYEVTESTSPLRSELSLTSEGSAGNPIIARFGWSFAGDGVRDATVVASVTDPSGTTREFPLRDDGVEGGVPDDGVYGAQMWSTQLAGTYRIEVSASGTDATGDAVARLETASTTLTSMVDVDGDGVADGTEVLFGLDPADPADGAVDHEGDGLSFVAELAAGTNPFSWDSDGGGQHDGSEVAMGRDPRMSHDDADFPGLLLTGIPRDDNRISVHGATMDGTASVRVFRLGGGGVTDLGLQPGGGFEVVDGPLPDGEFEYMGIVTDATGAESTPTFVGPYVSRTDSTSPTMRMIVNDGRWETRNQVVPVFFADLSEPVTEMRLANSLSALGDAAWVAFEPEASFTIGTAEGTYEIYGQVRDGSGLASTFAVESVYLDLTVPTSQAEPLATHYTTGSVNVAFTAADTGSYVERVELWSRHRPHEQATWGEWALASASDSSPIAFDFVSGDGLYEFYTIAQDGAGNRENPPSAADAVTRRDTTAPSSQAGPLIAEYSTPAIDVPFVATDAVSGVTAVELWWRHRVDAAGSWSAWAKGPDATSSPIAFAFEAGGGNYEFYTIAIDGAGNREDPPSVADAATTFVAEQTTTHTFTFASGLAGWTGSGTDCTSQHSNSDGTPAGSLSTTVSGKNRTATCTWSSPAGTWRDFGVPAGATVTSVRLESAASRVAACNDCLAGSIDGYRIRSGAGTIVAELWGGRALAAGTEAWQTVLSQPDQAVPSAWQPAETEVQLSLAATLNTGNKGSSKVTLNQDEIILVITYVATPCEAASPPTICATVSLHGNHPIGADVVGVGHAAATASSVTVEYQIKEWSWDDCTTQTIQPWTAAIAADGAFDEAVEEFDFSYPVLPSATTDHYQVYIRAAAGGQSRTEYYELPVNPTQTSCFVAP